MWPADDDFVLWHQVRLAGSPFAYAGSAYENWTGRFLTELLHGLAFTWPELFSLFAGVPPLMFALAPLVLVASLKSFDVDLDAPARSVVGSLMLAASYIGLLPYLGDCVFWLTGGIGYVVPLFISLLWVHAFTKETWRNRVEPALLLLLTVPMSLANEQTTAALIGAAATYALVRRKIGVVHVAAFALMIVGTLILLTAPGNAVRASLSPHGLSYSPIAWLSNYVSLIGATWMRFIGPVLGGLCVGFISALLWGQSVVNRRGLSACTAVMSAAAVGATLPFAAVPDFAVPRTAFIPGFYLLAASAGGAFLVLSPLLLRFRAASRVGAGLAACLVAAYVGLAILDWKQAGDMQPQQAARWTALQRQAGSGAEVTVPRFTGDPPLAIYVPDLSADASWWTNAAVARFFGLGSVRTAES
jgi:hypothetical protein